MKRAVICLGLITACAAWAQEPPPERVTVPFSDPSRPKTVKVSLINGSITVNGYNGNQVVIEAQGEARRHREAPEGMHRIDTGIGLQAEESDNVVTIGAGPNHNGSLTLQVPVNTSLKLTSVNGGKIAVDGISGDIEVNATNGAVTVTHTSGSVIAEALNGRVTVVLDKVTPGKPMSFSSLNGNIDVTLPADVKANVKMKSNNGEIFTDFDVHIEPSSRQPVVEGASGRGGRYRVRLDRTISGTINGGGPEMQFTTLNGNIYIRKAK